VEMIPRLSYPAGYIGEASAFSPLFPAAQTFTTPKASTSDIAFLSSWLKPPPPQELLVRRMFKPPCFKALTFWKQRTASEVYPLPFEPRNLHEMSLTCQLSPAMPTPLLATAPIVPAQWVPCPKSSAPPGEQLLFKQVRLSAL